GIAASIKLQQFAQIFVGSLGVSDMELNGLAGANSLRYRDRARIAIHANDVANQEIAALIDVLVFNQDAAHVQALSHQVLVAWGQVSQEFLKLLDSGFAAKCEDDIFLRLGDYVRFADGPAALRHNVAHADRPAQENRYRALRHHLRADEERTHARLLRSARH